MRSYARVIEKIKKSVQKKPALGVKRGRPEKLATPKDDEAFLQTVPLSTRKHVFRKQGRYTVKALTEHELMIYRAYKRKWYQDHKAEKKKVKDEKKKVKDRKKVQQKPLKRTQVYHEYLDGVWQMPDPDGDREFGEIIPPPL